MTNYVVEKKETSRKAWTAVTAECSRNSFKITGLNEGDAYMFRVRPENSLGLGVPAETKPVTVSMRPMPPGRLQFVDSTNSTVTVAWTKPEHNGGSEITGYVTCSFVPCLFASDVLSHSCIDRYMVEMTPADTDHWQTCVTNNALTATIKGLDQGKKYLFRVKARNEKGEFI